VGHIALTSKFVHFCSEKYPERSQKKTDFVWVFFIFEIKPNISKNAEKARFRPAFFVFEKKAKHVKKARFSQLAFKKAKLATLAQSVLTPVSSQSILKRKNGLCTWNKLNQSVAIAAGDSPP